MPQPRMHTYLPDPVFTFDNTSVLMIRSEQENHQFVMDLNETAQLHLIRMDDICVLGTNYPCYNYYDEIARLGYVLIALSPQACCDLQTYNKMLLIRGHKAWERQKAFYDMFNTPPAEPDITDYYDHQRWESICRFIAGIYSTDTFSFRSAEPPATSLFSGTTKKMPNAIKNYLRQLQSFLVPAFDELALLIGQEDNEF